MERWVSRAADCFFLPVSEPKKKNRLERLAMRLAHCCVVSMSQVYLFRYDAMGGKVGTKFIGENN